ncbi:MAG: ATP-binding protein, partial [Kiritimatiellae bacterium]|nr:ATP-binding protein [Kiritimatiellia bacterium]
MKRKVYDKLLHWKRHSAGKYALLLEGARRVGKSYIVKAFAEAEYERHLILDFSEVGRDIKDLFRNKLRNLDEFFMLLQVRTGVTLKPGNSLVVFDEVQRFPRAREAIKHLVADGRFHYLETGSLVSIRKNIDDILIPSEELRLQMHPMDFEEFLWALGRDSLWELVRAKFSTFEPMDKVDHDFAMECFRQYLVVGGMPQAVEIFATSRDLVAVEEAKRAILGLYRDDIGKFAGRLKAKVRSIWEEIPGALSRHERRFYPGLVGVNTKMRDMAAPFEWLSESMTVNICHNASDPNVGLKLTEDTSALKCYMADTGLLVSHAFSENELAAGGIAARLMLGETDVNCGMIV